MTEAKKDPPIHGGEAPAAIPGPAPEMPAVDTGEATAPLPPATQQSAIGPGSLFGGKPATFDEAWRFALMIARSQDMCPKQFVGKPEAIMVALQMGLEVGLSPLAALQNIAVINGRPSLWGDALIGICLAHPEMEQFKEWMVEEGDEITAFCAVKRRGYEWHTEKFSKSDAVTAGLWGKTGPWTQYPKIMLANRVRTFALRHRFADGLRGIGSAEEQRDVIIVEGEWSAPGPDPGEPQLDSAKEISDALNSGGSGGGVAGDAVGGHVGIRPLIKVPQEQPKPAGDAGAQKDEKKTPGRPSSLQSFKAELVKAENVKTHWEEKRALWQSKLGPDKFAELSTYAEGLEFDRTQDPE